MFNQNPISLVSDTINCNDINELCDWLKTYPRLTKGPMTLKYEQTWSQWLGTKHSLFVNSGSSANLIMFYALLAGKYIEPKSKVVVPSLSWATDLSPVMQLGLTPILCDCNLQDLSVDLDDLELIFKNEKPSVLILVSVLGFSPDMDAIVKLCDEYKVILLEDVCESQGTTYKGKKLGNFGLMSSFSTYFGHMISTIEGGMVCTNDDNLQEILLSIRSHGWLRDLSDKKKKELMINYEVDDFNSAFTFFYPGFNLRSTDLQAFIGIGQLKKIDDICINRNKNMHTYESLLKCEWKPIENKDSFTCNFAYPIIDKNKNQITSELKKNKIECRPLICGSMGRQPFYTDVYGIKTLNNADIVDEFGFYLPNHPDLTYENIKTICDIVNSNLGGKI